MTAAPILPGLQIDSALVHNRASNFCPPHWPPDDDFPITIDDKGRIVSRYKDSVWDFSPWAPHALTINFGDGTTRGAKIDKRNATLFRLISAWWLWGPKAVSTPGTLVGRHQVLKHLFVACSDAGILASDLSRYPRVVEKIARRIGPKGPEALSYLYRLWLDREALGFTILDDTALKKFNSLIRDRESTQTPYIPPRIWTYEVLRLQECLDDYLVHKDRVEACFRFCLQAYVTNSAGHLSVLTASEQNRRAPFFAQNKAKPNSTQVFHGSFRETAEEFGINQLLDRWVNFSDKAGIRALSSYLSLVTEVGLAYVLDFTLMRVEEGRSLRADCYEVERDPIGEDIHLIGGVTTKTIQDEDARWITSPSTKGAIEAMASVAFLRVEAAQCDPSVRLSALDIRNPLLSAWGYEPWISSSVRRSGRKRGLSYSAVVSTWPKLFDQGQLAITDEDLKMARSVTIGLDPVRFAVGKVWPLAWHQKRRTGAVNMLSSGLVSEASLQYQLKHASRAMTRYYGQHYYRLQARLDQDSCSLYVREMYDSLARELAGLKSSRYISPHGEKRKDQLLREISDKAHDALVKAGESGKISYRQTLLGGCAQPGGLCGLGSASNLVGCMGKSSETACPWVLLDKEKRPGIATVHDSAVARLKTAPKDSPLRESLQEQIYACKSALEAIDDE